jgi:hypothetical protein
MVFTFRLRPLLPLLKEIALALISCKAYKFVNLDIIMRRKIFQ